MFFLLFTTAKANEASRINSFDTTGIVAICKQDSQLVLTNFSDDPATFFKECGIVKKAASFFNGGSYSTLNRTVFAKVKRLQKPDLMDFNGNFDDFVYFNCEDVGRKVTIVLRIYDTQPVAGHVPGDNYVPFNPFGTHVKDCQIDVMVIDNTAPTIRCPTDISINCVFYEFVEPLKNKNSDYFDSYFGRIITQDCDGIFQSNSFSYTDDNNNVVLGSNGAAFDICKANILESLSSSFNCGKGTIKRTFQAIDAAGLKSMPCSQNITVISKIPIRLDPTIYRDPGTPATPCDGTLRRKIGFTEDFINDPLVSKDSIPMIIWPDKIVQLPNCVLYNDIGTSCDSTGFDAGRPIINTMEFCDQVAISHNDQVTKDTSGACIRITRNWSIRDTCQFGKKDTSWTYTQYITLVDHEVPIFTNGCTNDTVCSYPNDCFPTNVTLCTEAVDDCTPVNQIKYRYAIDINSNGTIDLQGTTSCVTINNASLAKGVHQITWTAEDNCGNTATCSKLFKVKDCSKPVAIAKATTYELSPNTCTAILLASKINQSSTDNCTPPNQLLFKVVKEKDWNPNFTTEEVYALPEQIVFTDTNVGANFVYLVVIDSDKNWSYFRTLAVVNNSINCNQKLTKSSTLIAQTETNIQVDSVDIYDNNLLRVSKALGNAVILTNDSLPHRFRLEKNRNFNNGVSTADLVAINKHILKIDSLQSPYQRIAADLNSDGKISTGDMIELRKFILFLNEGSPIRSWKFVDKAYKFFSNQPEKELYREFVDLDSKTTEGTYNFVGVKMGDVNNSVNPVKIQGESVERNAATLLIKVADQQIFEGQEVRLRLDLSNLMDQNGFQFCLKFDPNTLRFQQLVGLPAHAVNTSRVGEGLIPVSALRPEYGNWLDLSFTALQKGSIGEMLSIDLHVMPAEAYDQLENVATIQLGFSSLERDRLFQNSPNPYNRSTNIRFYLASPSEAVLTIFDQRGRLLKSIVGNYAQGLHEIVLNKDDLGQTGLLFYRLTSSTFEDTKKMIVLD